MTIKKYVVQRVKYFCKCGFEKVLNVDSEKSIRQNVVVKCPNCGKALEVTKL
jgi:predicted RNA-binding Zn-ribbon protein involved in translation (DUF1610 family)